MRQFMEKMMIVALGIAFWLPTTAWAQQGAGSGNYWGPHMMWGGGWMGGFSMIIFWILVIVAIYYGIKWATKSGDSQGLGRGENALEVLKRRYASGEIDRKQYQSMKKDLEED